MSLVSNETLPSVAFVIFDVFISHVALLAVLKVTTRISKRLQAGQKQQKMRMKPNEFPFRTRNLVS